jgi:hypothetical protein
VGRAAAGLTACGEREECRGNGCTRQAGDEVERAQDGRGRSAGPLLFKDAGHEDAAGSRIEVSDRPIDHLGVTSPLMPAQ